MDGMHELDNLRRSIERSFKRCVYILGKLGNGGVPGSRSKKKLSLGLKDEEGEVSRMQKQEGTDRSSDLWCKEGHAIPQGGAEGQIAQPYFPLSFCTLAVLPLSRTQTKEEKPWTPGTKDGWRGGLPGPVKCIQPVYNQHRWNRPLLSEFCQLKVTFQFYSARH